MKKINNKKLLITCLAIAPVLWIMASSGQTKHSKTMATLSNDEEFTIWTTLNVHNIDGTEHHEFDVSYKFIELMPIPIKTIIARYTAFIPTYLLDEDTELKLAQALGDFSTLKEARNTLLKDWTGSGLTVPHGITAFLRVKETEESLFFEHSAMYGNKITDEFNISKNGKITYLKQPEPIEEIPYSRKILLDEYAGFYLMLNGEPIEYFNSLYLDAENIKSVGVNKRDHIVYIEQKDKNPEYFVLSDLNQHLDSLAAFKVKSMDEITLISIEDETTVGTSHTNQFTEFDKIETSAIKSISSYIASPDEYDLKCVVFVLKK